MTTKEKEDKIGDLCDQHRCDDKTRKRHLQYYAHEHWNPHPTQAFIEWWNHHNDSAEGGINPVVAYNCQNYRQEYLAAREVGVA